MRPQEVMPPQELSPAGPRRRSLDRRSFLAAIGGATLGGLAFGGLATGCTSPGASTDGGSATTRPDDPETAPTSTGDPQAGTTDRSEPLQRLYLPMRDDVRLATDVWLPPAAATATVPAVLRTTRYGRSYLVESGLPADDVNAEEAQRWGERGYALIIVDARGSGASFGNRAEGDLAPAEIEDYGEVLTWIAAQPWSTGRIGSYGVSYDGDTAEMMARLGHPNLAAIAPQFSDYDPFRQLIFPGGVYLAGPFSQWLLFNDALDGVDGAVERIAQQFGVTPEVVEGQIPEPAPVDGADGPALVEEARRDHQDNLSLVGELPTRENLDERWTPLVIPTYREEIEAAAVPVLVQASWFDAGTAAGTLERFASFSNHQDVWIGPWDHGGDTVLDLAGIDPPPDFDDLSFAEQFSRLADFFDRFVRDGAPVPEQKTLRFTTTGEPGWTETATWPLPGVEDTVWYLDEAGLGEGRPGSASTVALSAEPHTSGEASRWSMNVSGDDADYSSWGAGASARTLFPGPELPVAMHIVGFPVVTIDVATDQTDGVVHAYLERVSADGEVVYLTEGLLRLSHRGPTPPAVRTDLPAERSFTAADRADMPPATVTRLTFELFPVSARLAAGERLQLSFATSDVDNFASYRTEPAAIDLVLDDADPSKLVLPTLPAR